MKDARATSRKKSQEGLRTHDFRFKESGGKVAEGTSSHTRPQRVGAPRYGEEAPKEHRTITLQRG